MKRFVIILFLFVVGAGGWYAWKSRVSSAQDVPAVFHGNVDIREVRLGFRVSGRLMEVLKDEGDQVKPGDVLAKLDDEPYRHSLSLAEAQVQAHKARLLELKNGNRIEEIEQVRKSLVAAEATEENARLFLQRQKQLVTMSATSQQDFDNAESSWRKALAQRDAAKANLDLLNAGTRAEQILQAEANLAAAEVSVAQAKTQLEDTKLIASEAGVVLTRAVEPGSIVQAGSTALTISLLSPVWGRAYVAEPQLGLIYPGREVFVYTDSRKTPYHGKIGDVSPRAEFTPKSVETTELRTALVYRFRVIIRDADDGLRQGMPVSVFLSEKAIQSSTQNRTSELLDHIEFAPTSAEAASRPIMLGFRYKLRHPQNGGAEQIFPQPQLDDKE